WLSAPGLRQDLEDLFHRLAALADVGPEPFEFDGDPSETQSEDQPAFADLVDGGGVLSQTNRMMEWRQDDPGADSDPGRDGGKGGADHEERRHVSVVDEVVLGGPHRREVETFRLDRQPDGLFVGSRPALFARTPLSTEQAETEGHGRLLRIAVRRGILSVTGLYSRVPPWALDLPLLAGSDILDRNGTSPMGTNGEPVAGSPPRQRRRGVADRPGHPAHPLPARAPPCHRPVRHRTGGHVHDLRPVSLGPLEPHLEDPDAAPRPFGDLRRGGKHLHAP